MFGGYGQGEKFYPRVLHISIARYLQDLPADGDPLQFLVSYHEEGKGFTWQHNVTIEPDVESTMLDLVRDLRKWTYNLALNAETARERADQLGILLYDSFIGPQGTKFFCDIEPTAVLFNVDETVLNLPWELIKHGCAYYSLDQPFGRLVTTRVRPKTGRDPLEEDTIVNLLVVSNPTEDLSQSAAETLTSLPSHFQRFRLNVDVISGAEATCGKFRQMVKHGNYDMLHFSGHAEFDDYAPENHALMFADGPLTAAGFMKLEWKNGPPYFVFAGACQSGRGEGGKRLVSGEAQSNGLAAAFLTIGVYAYAGFFWPVDEDSATLFTSAFYNELFTVENIGLAFKSARNYVFRKLWNSGDLTAFSAILFGDAGSEHRQDIVELV